VTKISKGPVFYTTPERHGLYISRVMQWGTGYEAAVARKDTITLAWLDEHGVTVEMVRAWQRFYEETFDANPENLSAKGRIELMSHCVELFEEQD
jgi:hypothetical protein